MQTELVRQLTIEDLSQNAVLDYIDGDIAFANRLRLPHVPHAKPVKIDALKLLICTKGTLQVDVNTKTRIIRANEVLCCLPLTVLRNAIGSDDLECKGIAIHEYSQEISQLGWWHTRQVFLSRTKPSPANRTKGSTNLRIIS